MRRLIFISFLFLASCGGSGALSLLTGGGPNVAANTQAGAENTQQAVGQQTETTAGRDVVQSTGCVATERVETIEVTNDRIPPWVLLLGLIGWLLPTPTNIGQGAFNAVMRLRRGKNEFQTFEEKPEPPIRR